MTEFVKFTLDDGSVVVFESASDNNLVSPRGGTAGIADGGSLMSRLQGVAEAAEQVAATLRSRLKPDDVSLEFGLKVSGEMSWFFAKAHSEGNIKVTLTWTADSSRSEVEGRPNAKVKELPSGVVASLYAPTVAAMNLGLA